MATGRREQAYAALFALLSASTYFRAKVRSTIFAFDQLQDLPGFVMLDGGEQPASVTHGVLTTACDAAVVIVVRDEIRQQIGTRLNEAREEILTLAAAWQTSALITANLVTSVKYSGMSAPDFDPTNSQKAAASLAFTFDLEDPAFETLSY